MLICLIGMGCSGKDTLLKKVLKDYGESLNLVPVVPYTTRPKRDGEIEGVEYHFVTYEQMVKMNKQGRILEARGYKVANGEVYYYFTEKFDINDGNTYITISTIDGVKSFYRRFGATQVHTIYLYVSDETRFVRAYNRESEQETPNYDELCRRFLQDKIDYSPAKLSNLDYRTLIGDGIRDIPVEVEFHQIYEEFLSEESELN